MLYVSVVDKKDKPVTELAPTDLVVREDGVQREVLRVTKASAPMPIAVLIDDSQAAERAIPDIRAEVEHLRTDWPGRSGRFAIHPWPIARRCSSTTPPIPRS